MTACHHGIAPETYCDPCVDAADRLADEGWRHAIEQGRTGRAQRRAAARGRGLERQPSHNGRAGWFGDEGDSGKNP